MFLQFHSFLFYCKKYGFVNHALQLLVLRNFGEETWEKIKKEANVSMEGEFLHRQIYCDAMSYKLVGAAVKILGKMIR